MNWCGALSNAFELLSCLPSDNYANLLSILELLVQIMRKAEVLISGFPLLFSQLLFAQKLHGVIKDALTVNVVHSL